MTMPRTCPNMTLAVERDVKTPTLTLKNTVNFANKVLVYLFIWGFMSLSTLYRSYNDG